MEAESRMDRYKRGKIKIPLYGGLLIIHITKDFSQVENREGLTVDGWEGYDALFFIKTNTDKREYHIWIGDQTPSNVAHESKHAVNAIFKDCHIELDRDNDEPECYLLGWIVEQVYNVINRDTKTR